MTTRREPRLRARWAISALAIFSAALFAYRAGFGQESQPDPPEGVEVQTRGPVHEAFAGIVSFRPEPGVVVPKAPPDSIEELPPDQKPAGANVAWIPGYWAWDDDRDDFLWVSGVWRALPPGRQWVPGYWNRTDDGYRWISGYWSDAQTSQVEYLPEPPESIDEGPGVEPTSPDQVWMPGSWIWYHGRYAWRPGYWATGRNNWMWVPASYVWTPRGYIFVDGYWDYAVARRGLLFAPVYINGGVYGQQGFVYSPAFAISMAIIADSLFLRPAVGHYYFGDYYAPSYASAGFYPWFAFQNQYRNGYDPIFASQQWQHRQNPGWQQNLEAQFERRRENEGARPPRTLAAQSAGGKVGAAGLIAVPVAHLGKGQIGEFDLQPVSKTERHELQQSGQKIRDYSGARQKLDAHAPGTAAGKPGKESEPARGKLPKSPIAAGDPGHLDEHEAPPEPHKAPQPDPSVQPGTSKPASRPAPGDVHLKTEPRHGPSKPESPAPPKAPGAVPNAKKPELRPEPPGKGPAPKPEPPKAGPPAPANPAPKPAPQPPPPPPKKPAPAPKPEAPKAGPPAPGQPPAKPPPQPAPPSKKPGPPPAPEPDKKPK